MSQRALYLQLNKQFASQAALLSLREPELHLDHALLSFLASITTLATFADVSAHYLAMKVLDHVVGEGLKPKPV